MSKKAEYTGSELFETFEKVAADSDDYVIRYPGGSNPDDPRSSIKKPAGKYWTKVPETEGEKSIYFGLHIHTQENPLGLHSHIPGGPLSGGHTHGPGNKYGEHFHGPNAQDRNMVTIDGKHIHKLGENMPSGPHEHCPELFG